jgi:hydroxyacylglutathione hydrolase
MLFRMFYDPKLAQASYLIGCAVTGEALVVDPNRDISQYLDAAHAEGMLVAHVTETHIHADFASGSRELARAAGAQLYLSGEGGPDWQYAFAKSDDAVILHDGDTFDVGNIQVKALHTPGHTPEHLSFMVTDRAATERPMGMFTGDFLFVGDVGRPDLLERAAKIEGTMEASARQLFQSLRNLAPLPDYLQIWPGHGAGSACGKALGAVPQSTLGYERLVNWALSISDEQAFVDAVLAGQPEPPKYFAEMKRMNREGPRLLGEQAAPEHTNIDTLLRRATVGDVVVDTRPASDFAAGHVPGTISIPMNKSFTKWAGWLMPYDRDFHLIVADGSKLAEVRRDLAMIGLDRMGSWAPAEALEEWAAGGGKLQLVRQMTPADLAAEGEDAVVLDVRDRHEWNAGHLPGVPNIPLGELADRLDEVPEGRPLVLHCQGGGRSSIAASVLQAQGLENVINLVGGFGAWQKQGHPVEHAEEEVGA